MSLPLLEFIYHYKNRVEEEEVDVDVSVDVSMDVSMDENGLHSAQYVPS
jgi:hypothetical protein